MSQRLRPPPPSLPTAACCVSGPAMPRDMPESSCSISTRPASRNSQMRWRATVRRVNACHAGRLVLGRSAVGCGGDDSPGAVARGLAPPAGDVFTRKSCRKYSRSTAPGVCDTESGGTRGSDPFCREGRRSCSTRPNEVTGLERCHDVRRQRKTASSANYHCVEVCPVDVSMKAPICSSFIQTSHRSGSVSRNAHRSDQAGC